MSETLNFSGDICLSRMLELADEAAVLARFGNMSSATILFVLADMMARGASGEGIAIAFGPGLAAEAIRFRA